MSLSDLRAYIRGMINWLSHEKNHCKYPLSPRESYLYDKCIRSLEELASAFMHREKAEEMRRRKMDEVNRRKIDKKREECFGILEQSDIDWNRYDHNDTSTYPKETGEYLVTYKSDSYPYFTMGTDYFDKTQVKYGQGFRAGGRITHWAYKISSKQLTGMAVRDD